MDELYARLSAEDGRRLCALTVERIACLIAAELVEDGADEEEGGLLLQGIDEEG